MYCMYVQRSFDASIAVTTTKDDSSSNAYVRVGRPRRPWGHNDDGGSSGVLYAGNQQRPA